MRRFIAAGVLLLSVAPFAHAGDAWQLEATPYLWAAGMKGDVGVGKFTANGVEATFPDIFQSLRAGFMGSLEGRTGRGGFYLDAIYMQLDQEHPAQYGFLGDVQARVTQQAYTAAATWRVVEGPSPVDLFLGARSSDLKVDLNVTPSVLAPAGRSAVKSRGWVDGFVGARVSQPLNERWRVVGYADIGAGGSDSTWQIDLGAAYAFSEAIGGKFGYRLVKVDYHHDDFLYNMKSGGLYGGVAFRF